MDTFLGSLVQSRCGEGGTLQTSNTGMGLQCLSHAGPAPRSQNVCPPCPHCSGSRLLCLELSEAGPGLYVPPRSKLLRFRHSGSPQRRKVVWACVLCPSQVWEAQVMRCLVSAVAVTYHLSRPCWRIPGRGEPGGLQSMGSHRVGHDWSDLAAVPAAWFSGGTTSAPSQVDDCPEPQEVLVSKEACLLFGR